MSPDVFSTKAELHWSTGQLIIEVFDRRRAGVRSAVEACEEIVLHLRDRGGDGEFSDLDVNLCLPNLLSSGDVEYFGTSGKLFLAVTLPVVVHVIKLSLDHALW